LCEASRIRNRIAHRKSTTDLYISDPELAVLHNGVQNFKELVAGVFHSSGVASLRIARTFFTGSEEEYWESIRKMAEEVMSDEK